MHIRGLDVRWCLGKLFVKLLGATSTREQSEERCLSLSMRKRVEERRWGINLSLMRNSTMEEMRQVIDDLDMAMHLWGVDDFIPFLTFSFRTWIKTLSFTYLSHVNVQSIERPIIIPISLSLFLKAHTQCPLMYYLLQKENFHPWKPKEKWESLFDKSPMLLNSQASATPSRFSLFIFNGYRGIGDEWR